MYVSYLASLVFKGKEVGRDRLLHGLAEDDWARSPMGETVQRNHKPAFLSSFQLEAMSLAKIGERREEAIETWHMKRNQRQLH